MSKKMGSSTSGIADYTTKIAADQKALDLLTTANDNAAAAMVKANKQLVYNAVTLGLTSDQAVIVAHKMGLMDDATFNMVVTAEGLNKSFTSGLIPTVDTLGQRADDLAVAVTGTLIPAFDNVPGSIQSITTAADVSRDAFIQMRDKMEAIHDVSSTITINHVDTYTSTNAQSGIVRSAGGADFVVPPGFPNDSFPMRVQSGEHVVVTPAAQGPSFAGGSGGGRGGGSDAMLAALINNLPGMMARAVRDAMQR